MLPSCSSSEKHRDELGALQAGKQVDFVDGEQNRIGASIYQIMINQCPDDGKSIYRNRKHIFCDSNTFKI